MSEPIGSIDVCKECEPSVTLDYPHKIEHPPYENEEIDCALCGKRLTEEDN